MDFQSIVSWLLSEAGAGWVFGLVTLAASLSAGVYALRRRERPSRVVVQEIKRTKLLDIHPSQRDRLTVVYQDGKATAVIEDLEQKELVIYNNGTRDILEPLEFELRFAEPRSTEPLRNRFLRWFFDDARYASAQLLEESVERADSDQTDRVSHGVSIKLDHLNSCPIHQEYIRAYLVSDGEIDIALRGRESGRGWSARFVGLDQVKKVQRRTRSILEMFPLLMILLGGTIASLLLSRWAKASGSGIQDPGFLGMVIGVILGGFVSLSLIDPIRRMLSQRWLRAPLPSEFKQTRG